MNPIEKLQSKLQESIASIQTKLRKPRNPEGTWWLDASLDDHGVTVEWSPTRGFGVTASMLTDGYGEGPEEVFDEPKDALRRVTELLREHEYTEPPRQVLLHELRALTGLTQQALAEKLGVQQAAVSRLERRDEITVRSLRRYVEALGGTLEITFRGPDGTVFPVLGSGVAEPRAVYGHAHPTQSGAPQLSRQPRLSLLVLRCADLARSSAFYRALGFDLAEEKHGSGPVHCSFELGGALVELYPCTEGRKPSAVRLGLALTTLQEKLRQLSEAGFLSEPPKPIRRSTKTEVFLIRDPDDNVLELESANDDSLTASPPHAG